MPTNPDKPTRTFSLNLKTPEVSKFLESEKRKSALSKTGYLNELLSTLSSFPRILSKRRGSMLSELIALKQLLSDDVMSQIPHLAAATRRDPVQMLLHLVEKGLEADKQLAGVKPLARTKTSSAEKPLAAGRSNSSTSVNDAAA